MAFHDRPLQTAQYAGAWLGVATSRNKRVEPKQLGSLSGDGLSTTAGISGYALIYWAGLGGALS